MSDWRSAIGAPVRVIVAVLALAGALHLGWAGIYQFPPAEPFAGPHWYDPYDGVDFGALLRANFHSHSRLIPGVTWGEHPPERVRAHYRELGYDVYPLSNYQSVAEPGPDEEIPIHAYEHGYSLSLQHYTVIGRDRAHWLDFPLFQHRFATQYLIDTLSADADLLVVNHPQRRDAFPPDQMRRLTGIHGIEVRSRFAKGREHWDAALSAGRPVWGFCSDDQHDLDGSSPAGIGWVWVAAGARRGSAVTEALRSGAHYGVYSRRGPPPNRVVEARFDGETWRVHLERPADALRFVGQDGRVLAETSGAREARYRTTESDSYVRFEAENGKARLFLNPIFRHAGREPLAGPQARWRPWATLALRAVCIAVGIAVPWALLVPERRSEDAPAHAPDLVLPNA